VANAVNVGRTLFVDQASPELSRELNRAGFELVETPLGEFLKAGGSAKCLTLRLNEAVPKGAREGTSIQTARVRIEGHLLASGLLDHMVDVIVDGGGSFRILNFQLGRQRQSTSDAEVQVSAPAPEVLEKVLPRLIELGAVVAAEEEGDVELAEVLQAGVAPEGFYATTIYPTTVRVDRRWLHVQAQRMDAVIAIRGQGDGLQAQCKLFRQLGLGEKVVVGNRGIRLLPKDHVLHTRMPQDHEFAFMGASVSSERRVELAVDRVAWEMRRIRSQGRIFIQRLRFVTWFWRNEFRAPGQRRNLGRSGARWKSAVPIMTREEALKLLDEYTQSESLRKHAFAVEAAMKAYAPRFGGDPELWAVTGLLHDFDYERWPNPPDHTREGARILRQRGVPEEIVGAILSHATWNQDEYPLDRPLRKTLFAVDELCGFVTAVAYVRPEKMNGMAPSSVRKKMKQKSFAAAVKREDIERGAQLLDVPLDEHIANVIAAMQTVAGALGFA
jgi:putative nucleotidyltransferase with HDIG domain